MIGLPSPKTAPVSGPPIPRRTITIALVVALAQFMQMLDSSVINIAVPRMASDFHVSPVAVGLGITVYVLSASIIIPASVWLADWAGAKTLFILALATFAFASALCGLSATLPQFIAARALQGIAGALMAPVGQMILLASVERAQLLRVMTITSASMLVAPVIGPPLGGLLTTWLSWPWIFYINLPVAAIAITMALRWFPHFEQKRRRPFDALGFFLNAAALAPLLWGLQELGGTSTLRAVGAILAGLTAGLFALRHLRRAPHPLLSLAPLRHATFRLTTGSSAILIRLPITALIFILPIMLQAGFGMSAFLSGSLFLGHSGGDLTMKLFTTRIFRRFGFRTVLITATIGMAFSISAAASFTATTPYLLIGAVLLLSGCFRSFVMTGLTTLAFSDVERAEMPSATTLAQVVVQLTTALSISLSSLVLGLSRLVRNGAPNGTAPADCRAALIAMATLAFLAVPLLRRLPHDAGAEMSGHGAELHPGHDFAG